MLLNNNQFYDIIQNLIYIPIYRPSIISLVHSWKLFLLFYFFQNPTSKFERWNIKAIKQMKP